MGRRRENDNSFIVQGSILAIAAILSRIIGFIYRVPLTNIIGDEGNGFYGSAFEIYSTILLISSYSLPLAVSKLVSARVARGQYKNAYRIFKSALIFALAVGTIAGLGTFFGADFIAGEIMSNPMSAIALKVLAPTVLIVAVMGVLRGYFQGLGTMMPTAVSQILEQIVNAIVSVAAAYYLYEYGKMTAALLYTDSYAPAYGAAGGTLGTLAGAVIGFLFLLFVALTYRRVLSRQAKKDRSVRVESYPSIYRMLLLTIAPVILSTAVYNISNIIDNGIFFDIMEKQNVSDRVSIWGIFTGKYRLLINVPISIASALSASAIPSLTAAIADRNKALVNKKINTSIRFVMVMAIPCSVGLAVLASPILQLLFGDTRELPANLLHVGSTAVIFYSLSTLTNGILQGINKMHIPVRNAVVSLVIHIGVLYFMLVPLKLGVYGVVYANMVFALLMCIFNAIALKRAISYRQEVIRTFVIPAIASAVMGLAAFLIHLLIVKITQSNSAATIIALLTAAAVYFAVLLLLHGVTEEELRSFPAGKKLASIAKKLHLL